MLQIDKKIAVIGAGNIGLAIVEGILMSKLFKPENIYVSRRRIQLIKYLTKEKVNISTDNSSVISNADIIIIAVKPHQFRKILQNNKVLFNKNKIIVSIVTGVNIENIQSIVGANIPIFRAMPNTAIKVCESMTCISCSNVLQNQKDEILQIFQHLGEAIYIQDELMDSATILASSGIAYALRYIRAAMQGGIEIGFDSDRSQLIVVQTVIGAAKLLQSDKNHPEREIDKVTTPRGITISGLNEMEHQGFSSALIKGLINSYTKIKKL